MLKKVQQYFVGIPAVFIDGMLYVWIAVLTFISTQFSSDDAEKYITPQMLFWSKMLLGSISTGLVSLKMFRSTAFAEHQEEKKKTGNTEFIVK